MTSRRCSACSVTAPMKMVSQSLRFPATSRRSTVRPFTRALRCSLEIVMAYHTAQLLYTNVPWI